MLKNKKGFTLVELMVVVVIIGILTAIAIPVYNNVTANAETNACKDNQRTIDSAIMMYVADSANKGAYPAAITDLVPNYLAKAPVCPTGGTYSFIADANGHNSLATCSETAHKLHDAPVSADT